MAGALSYRLMDRALDGQLESRLRAMRADGLTCDQITRIFNDEGWEVSRNVMWRWLKDLGLNGDDARGRAPHQESGRVSVGLPIVGSLIGAVLLALALLPGQASAVTNGNLTLTAMGATFAAPAGAGVASFVLNLYEDGTHIATTSGVPGQVLSVSVPESSASCHLQADVERVFASGFVVHHTPSLAHGFAPCGPPAPTTTTTAPTTTVPPTTTTTGPPATTVPPHTGGSGSSPSGDGGGVSQSVASHASPSAPSSSPASLAFTGFDADLFAAIGALLLAVGTPMAIATRRNRRRAA